MSSEGKLVLQLLFYANGVIKKFLVEMKYSIEILCMISYNDKAVMLD